MALLAVVQWVAMTVVLHPQVSHSSPVKQVFWLCSSKLLGDLPINGGQQVDCTSHPSPLSSQAWADLMNNVSQEGQADVAIAQAAEQVFRALIDGCLQDMATGASEVRGAECALVVKIPDQRTSWSSNGLLKHHLATGCKCTTPATPAGGGG